MTDRRHRVRIAELWRYPVKSLQGERLDGAELGAAGVAGDRRYAIFDVVTGFGLTARRAPELLHAAARLLPGGAVEITLPDGTVARDDAALSAWLGREVRLQRSEDVGARRYENPSDTETEAASSWTVFEGSRVAFHDDAVVAVSLLSRATAGDAHPRRFRANVLLDGGGEDRLVGSTVRVGAALVDVRTRIARCVMVTRPQPGGIEPDREVLRRIHRERGGVLAVGGPVLQPGVVRIGDAIALAR